jgi:hypothetical protein
VSDPEPAPKKKGSLATTVILSLLLAVAAGLNLRPSYSVSSMGLRADADRLVTVSYGFPLTYYVDKSTRHADGSIAPSGKSGNETVLMIDQLLLNVLLTLFPSLFVAFWVRQMFGVKYKDGDNPL